MNKNYPVIPWIGGKRRLAKTILPLFPEHTCYVEPFCGAAALYFMKDQAEVEVLNDINGELINMYRVVKHHLEEFIRQFKWALVSREMYRWLQITPEETLTDIQRPARFYYLQKLSFGGKVDGRTFGTAELGPFLVPKVERGINLTHSIKKAFLAVPGRTVTVKASTERYVIIYSMVKSSMGCGKLKLS